MLICNNTRDKTCTVTLSSYGTEYKGMLAPGERTSDKILFGDCEPPRYSKIEVTCNGITVATRPSIECNTYVGLDTAEKKFKLYVHFNPDDTDPAKQATQEMIARVKRILLATLQAPPRQGAGRINFPKPMMKSVDYADSLERFFRLLNCKGTGFLNPEENMGIDTVSENLMVGGFMRLHQFRNAFRAVLPEIIEMPSGVFPNYTTRLDAIIDKVFQ